MPHLHSGGDAVTSCSRLRRFFHCRKGCDHHSLTRPDRDRHESGCRPYDRNDLIKDKKTGERAAVLSCSVSDVVALTARGEIKSYEFNDVERA